MSKHISDCVHCRNEPCAHRVQIFSTLDEVELSRIVQLIIRRKYGKGELIILEGSNLESLIIINRGQVKAFRDTLEGKEQILYIFSAGDFFGEKNLLRNKRATYHVEALEETHLCMIHQNDFKQLLREFPDIGFKIMEELCDRLDRLESAIESMGVRSVEARVSMVLLEFSKKYGKKSTDGILIELPLSREGIANYIGLTRETVSRRMSLLQDEGIIRMIGNKRIMILNKKALEQSIE